MATQPAPRICHGYHPGDKYLYLYLRRRDRRHGPHLWLRRLRRQASTFIHRFS